MTSIAATKYVGEGVFRHPVHVQVGVRCGIFSNSVYLLNISHTSLHVTTRWVHSNLQYGNQPMEVWSI